MAAFDVYDVAILAGVMLLSVGYLVSKNKSSSAPKASSPTLAEIKAKSTAKSRSLISKLESLNHEKMVVLFYGSQTGTAEDLAIRTQNDISSKLEIPCVVLDPDEYEMEELQEWKSFGPDRLWIVGFFMATYGEGEPTDNCTDFYSWIMDGHGTVEDKGDQDDYMTDELICEGMRYFIFGLGNKTYEHFNAISRRLDKRLTKMGAIRIGERGEGDDDASMEEDYLKWVSGFLKSLADSLGVSLDSSSKDAKPHIPLFNTEYLADLVDIYQGELTLSQRRKWKHVQLSDYEEVNPAKSFDGKHPYYGKFAHSRPLFINAADKFEFKDSAVSIKSKKIIVDGTAVTVPRQCYHIELELGSSGLNYQTGDHVGLFANNNPGEVEKLGNFLKIKDMNAVVKMVRNSENSLSATAKDPFPQPSTIRNILTHYVDILATVKQHHFKIFAKYSDDPSERARLFHLSENREDFVQLVESSQKTLACVLEDFKSIQLPLSVALTEILRPVTVRYYSISSSAMESPNTITVTAVLVRYAIEQKSLNLANTKKPRVIAKEGFATSWLERVHESRLSNPSHGPTDSTPILHVPLYIRSSNFRLPSNQLLPIIMVGPGTGVAPFRGFLRERVIMASKGKVGDTWLFTGSRNEKSDFLYGDEFASLLKEVEDKNLPIQLKVVTAFSRDTEKKVYVQHKLEEHAETVWELLKTGSFYICGDAKRMAADVNHTLERIAVNTGGLSESAARDWMKSLRSQNRFLEDVWS